MDFRSKIENFTTKQVVHLILELLENISDENLVRLTYLAEKLTSDKEVLSGIAGVRRLLQDPNHPAKDLFRRVLDYLPQIYTTRCHQMDAYAKSFAELADPVWKNEYMKNQENVNNPKAERPYQDISANVQHDLPIGM